MLSGLIKAYEEIYRIKVWWEIRQYWGCRIKNNIYTIQHFLKYKPAIYCDNFFNAAALVLYDYKLRL